MDVQAVAYTFKGKAGVAPSATKNSTTEEKPNWCDVRLAPMKTPLESKKAQKAAVPMDTPLVQPGPSRRKPKPGRLIKNATSAEDEEGELIDGAEVERDYVFLRRV